MVWHRRGMLAPALQSRPRPAAHDRQAGRAVADGRNSSNPAGEASRVARRASRRVGGARRRRACARLVAAADLNELGVDAVLAAAVAIMPSLPHPVEAAPA